MTGAVPEPAVRAFEANDAFERVDDGFAATTVAFETRVTAVETDDRALQYRVEVRVPTLSAATSDDVGAAVEDGWFETFRRRLADATMATRASVEFDEFAVVRDGEHAVATFAFTFGDADRAAAVVKAIVEYVEGTYVEGVVPGYDYEPPVAGLLASASQGGNGQGGGTPL